MKIQMPWKKQKSMEEIKKELGYDPVLLREIQPAGGISFRDEKVIRLGDGYVACVRIYQFSPKVNTYWLSQFTNLPNVIAVFDVGTENIEQVKKNINMSIKEQKARFYATSDFGEQSQAQYRFQELENVYHEVSQMGEAVKLLYVRLLVPGRTLEDLEKNIKNVVVKLEGDDYKSAVFLNETESEFASLYQSYGKQEKSVYRRKGHPVLSETLAGGNPFHFSSLSDTRGMFLGTTTTGGSVLLDNFHADNYRLSYGGFVAGTMGSGKSTLLKKIILNNAIIGNYIRGFDPTGEFTTLIQQLGGKIIYLDGTSSVINPLEILETSEQGEGVSFKNHLGNLTTVYKLLMPEAKEEEVLEYELLLRELYLAFGIIDENNPHKKCTGLDNTAYPIVEDMIRLIDSKISKVKKYTGTSKDELEKKYLTNLGNIQTVLKNLVKNYGEIFNRHSSMMDITNEQIVFFNIQNLASGKETIFDAQIFSALQLCWGNCVKVGSKSKERYEKQMAAAYAKTADDREVSLEEEIMNIKYEVKGYMIILDEAHKIINANKLQAVEQMTVVAREARKFFGAPFLATQSVRSMVPEGSSNGAVQQMKILFELMQYKFIMKQDRSAISTLSQVLEGELSEAHLKDIPRLDKGETILCMAGYKAVRFGVYLTETESMLFKGGV